MRRPQPATRLHNGTGKRRLQIFLWMNLWKTW
jgi:hypothetical protein